MREEFKKRLRNGFPKDQEKSERRIGPELQI